MIRMKLLVAASFALPLLALFVSFTLTGCQTPGRPAAATGPQYVRVEKIDGRWWFVRGQDRFFSLGVNVVVPADNSKPRKGGIYNALPKYNGDVAAWAEDAANRLRSWNINTVAGWSHDQLYNNVAMYHTRVVWFGPWGNHDSRLIDVFADAYAKEIDKTAREQIAPHATNEFLIGWFSNNELPWYGEKGWPSSPDVSILTRYMTLPEKAPGKVRALEFLKEVYSNDFAAFSRNWKSQAASFEELARLRRMKPAAREAKRDVVQWAGIVAEQYFKLSHEALRRYDTNHLYLGVRFAGLAQEPVIAALARYADVISINIYRKTGDFDTTLLGAIAALTGRPLMITEYSWRAMENSSGCANTIGADVTVQTQQDRADRYRTYMTNAIAQPYVVGCDWFMYHDQPPGGRFDGENSNYGLVDIHDNFYMPILNAMTEIGGRANDLHRHSTATTPAYDPVVLASYRELSIPNLDQPLAEPVVLVDSTSAPSPWGDTARGAEVSAQSSGDAIEITGSTGKGWGFGVTFAPSKALETNPDGSVNVLGASRIVVRLRSRAGVRFSVGVQESGHAPTDAQTFDGYAGSDGESYVTPETATEDGFVAYSFEMNQMEAAAAYGNQRGNSTINTHAIAQCHLFFPGGQGDIRIELVSITFE